jgi:hypothetical protein
MVSETLTGLVRCKNGIVKLETGTDVYVVDNLIEMQITVNFTKEAVPQLSNMISQQYITGLSYTGNLSAYVCTGIANRITDYIEARGDVPPIKIIGALADPASPKLGHIDTAKTDYNKSKQIVIAEGIIPDSLQLIRVASSESDAFMKYDMPFSANKVTTYTYFDSNVIWETSNSQKVKDIVNSTIGMT